MKLYLAIPVPAGGSFYWPLAMWLESLPIFFSNNKWGYYRDTVEGGPIAHNRNSICHRFLDTDADVLWMVDSDMNPSVEGLDYGGVGLITEAMDRDDVDIVSGVSFRIGEDKNGPVPCVNSFEGETGEARKRDVMERIFSAPPGLHEVNGISTGGACLAIKRHVVEDFYEREVAWFLDHYHTSKKKLGNLLLSEDLHFITKAQEFGHRFWVDTRIVWGHVKRMDLRDELERAKELMARATQEAVA